MRTSVNSIKAKFAEFPFPALRGIEVRSRAEGYPHSASNS
jgi:hypothetical protein